MKAIYLAGPIDYVEHRTTGDHLRSNWRHRFFDDNEYEVLCPTCINRGINDWHTIMANNAAAIARADAMIAYFPGDVATFGTSIEVYDWLREHGSGEAVCLIHPAPAGVFVQMFKDLYKMTTVARFEEAHSWLRHLLTRP